MKKYIIWDFDGTLGYSELRWRDILANVMKKELGVCVTPEATFEYTKRGMYWHSPQWQTPHKHIKTGDDWWLNGCFTQLFSDAVRDLTGITDFSIEKIISSFRAEYTRLDKWFLFEDAKIVLENLINRGCEHYLLTNHMPEFDLVATHLGVKKYFKKIFNSFDTGVEKPHPESYENVLAEISDKSQAVMIGDNPVADFKGANDAGIDAILVRRKVDGIEPFCNDLYCVENKIIDTIS